MNQHQLDDMAQALQGATSFRVAVSDHDGDIYSLELRGASLKTMVDRVMEIKSMTEKAPEVTLVCACGSRAFYATPDGADSYILQCSACGCHSEISAGRGMTLSLTEVADAPAEPKD